MILLLYRNDWICVNMIVPFMLRYKRDSVLRRDILRAKGDRSLPVPVADASCHWMQRTTTASTE